MEILPISISSALTMGFDVIGDTMEIFMKEPSVYFIALALISAGAGVSRKFVPMKRR